MRIIITTVMIILLLSSIACQRSQRETPQSSLTYPYDLGHTAYGFFPSPPEPTGQSVLDIYQAIGQHADVILFHQNIPWADFTLSIEAESKTIIDMETQFKLAHENGLGVIVVVDPLNTMNRQQIFGLPVDWEASFANPQVRTAFTNFVLRVVREFHPSYLGLASEINTYADTHPDDFKNYLSLYNSVYNLIKAEAPQTNIFVTFQWEELNNLIPSVAQGNPRGINWNQVEQFEPNLDLWAISSYPYIYYPSGKDIPSDYYSPLLNRTSKPLAVAEGGYSSGAVDSFKGTPQDQVDYLNAIHTQIGGNRLAFWIYLLLYDFNVDSYAEVFSQQGIGNASALGIFASVGLCYSDGTPKPALAIWDSFHKAGNRP